MSIWTCHGKERALGIEKGKYTEGHRGVNRRPFSFATKFYNRTEKPETEKGGSICSLACLLMSEPGLPSAPVCSKFTRRSSVSQGWEAMCRSWAQTKGLGVATLLSGTSQAVRPPRKVRAKRVSAWLWADLKLHRNCHHHLLGFLLQSYTNEPTRCLSSPWGC